MTEETSSSQCLPTSLEKRCRSRLLDNRLKELEDTEAQPTTPAHVQKLYTKLKDLDSNFKDFHLLVIDQIDGDEALEAEQAFWINTMMPSPVLSCASYLWLVNRV